MSNTNVGNVYQQIIRDVVESSRIDFEEGGVEEGVLEELSRVSEKNDPDMLQLLDASSLKSPYAASI